jgi:nitrogen-specific signal transduction histidine kinase
MVPVCLIAAFLVHEAYRQKRSLIEQHMQGTARALRSTLEFELADVQTSLQVLSTSPSLAKRDFAAFHAQALQVLQFYPGADIILADETGQQLVNTYRSFGEALPKRNVPDLVRRVFDGGKPVISDLFHGAVTKRPLIGVDVPVMMDGRVAYDLAMTLPTDRLSAILARQKLPKHWTASILDRQNVIAARTEAPEQFVGRQVGPILRQEIATNGEGQVVLPNLAQVRVFDAYSRSPEIGWAVVIGVPEEAITAELRQWLAWALGGSLVLMTVSTVLAFRLSASIAHAIRQLVPPAVALGRDQPVVVPPTRLAETQDVGNALLGASHLLALRAGERDRAEQALLEGARALQRQYDCLRSLNGIAALPQADAARQLTEALALGLRHLGLTIGIIAQVDGSRYTIRHHVAPPEAGLADDDEFELSATCCAKVIASGELVALSAPEGTECGGHPGFDQGPARYVGAPIMVDGRCYGTVNFSSAIADPHPFDAGDLEFIRLLARWMGALLEREVVHRELARSNAELEQFAYVASHDLREPLRQISSFVTLLERRYGDALDGEAREFIAFASDGARRMDRLILDLLDYSRIGRHERPRIPQALADVVAEAQANLGIVIQDCAARIEVVGDLPTVSGDHTELVRLFQNLIGNAIKYREPSRPPVVTISARRDGQVLVVEVADNGIGIAREHFDRIFRIFQRLHSYGQYEGTGIGLAACRKIAEHHGGRIWLESEPGRGSRFFVALPSGMGGKRPV